MAKYDVRITVWVTEAMAKAMDQWQRDRRVLMTRPEAMRQLAEAALVAFTPEMIQALTAWAASQPDQPDWPEAARRLLVQALAPAPRE